MSLKNLQTKIGIPADGSWGAGTFKAAMAYYKLSPVRAAHFFAQTAHETGGFNAFSENLNYSAKGLRGIFKKYFPTDASSQKRLLIASTHQEWVMVLRHQAMASDTVVVEHCN